MGTDNILPVLIEDGKIALCEVMVNIRDPGIERDAFIVNGSPFDVDAHTRDHPGFLNGFHKAEPETVFFSMVGGRMQEMRNNVL